MDTKSAWYSLCFIHSHNDFFDHWLVSVHMKNNNNQGKQGIKDSFCMFIGGGEI